MNGNRMKYSSTPTYGMQKRSFLKKSAPVRKAPEAPDFSQAPDPAAGMPFQQPFAAQPQQPFVQQQPSPQSTYVPPAAPYFPAGAPAQQPVAQVPFAAPSFMPQTGGMQVSPMQSTSQQLPLGNTVAPFQNSAGFSSRAQGFVPPAPQQPAASTVPPAAAMQQPFAGMNMPPMQQPQPYQQAQPFQQQMVYQTVQPAQPVPQQPAPPTFAQMQQQAAARAAQEPRRALTLDADKLWSIFLFGLLPLLFIPCLFVPDSWDFLRYAFLVLTVVGLGAMWYRQMYTPPVRLIVSMVFVALCIGNIAMLMQGPRDAQLASGGIQQPAVSQQTPSPADANAAAAPVATPTPAPTYSGPSEAERRLELFMSLWQVNNTTEMVSLVQPSWCSQQENPSQSLFNVLKNRTPEDFTIEEISGTETDNSRTITMRATINKNTGKAPTIYRFMIMMVKEGGEWYVNPNSLATNDEVETTDENVVNNKNAGGTVTEPPRTTVTPAPPASTQLYYNDGANYYHMDPNCASVKSEYLPFDFQFNYGDLKTVMNENGLSPCLKCNAPTNTLD